MRHCNESQIDQDKILDDCCYMTSALVTSTPKIMLLLLSFFLNTNFAKRGSCLLKENKKS